MYNFKTGTRKDKIQPKPIGDGGEYQGWKNWETWTINLALQNDYLAYLIACKVINLNLEHYDISYRVNALQYATKEIMLRLKEFPSNGVELSDLGLVDFKSIIQNWN